MTVLKKLICKKVKSDEDDFLTMVGAGRGNYGHFVFEKSKKTKTKKKKAASTPDDTSNDTSSTANTGDVSSPSPGPSIDALPAVMDFVQIKIGSRPSQPPTGGNSTSSFYSTKHKQKSAAAQSIASPSSSRRRQRQQGYRKPKKSSSPAPSKSVFDAVKTEFGNLDDLGFPAEWIIDYNLFDTPTAPKWKTSKAPPISPSLKDTDLPRITSSVRRHYLDVEEKQEDVDERDELEDDGGSEEDKQFIVEEVRKSLRPEPRRSMQDTKEYLDTFTYKCTDEIAQGMVPNNPACLLTQCGGGGGRSSTSRHQRNIRKKEREIPQVLFHQAAPKDSELAKAMRQRIQIQEQEPHEEKQRQNQIGPQRMHIQEPQEEQQRRIQNGPSEEEEKEELVLFRQNDSSEGIIAPKPILATAATTTIKKKSSMRSQSSSSTTEHRAKTKKMMRWADVLEEVQPHQYQEESTAWMIAKAAATLKEQHRPLPLPSSDYLDRFRKNDHRGRAKVKSLPKDGHFVDHGDDDSYFDDDDDTSYNSLLSIDRSSAYDDYYDEEDDDYTSDYDDGVVVSSHQGVESTIQYDEQSVGTMELVCNHVTCAPSDRLRAIDWLR